MAEVPNNADNSSRCICGECPSFPQKGGFYCAEGKSEAPVRKRGCLCGDCAVFKEYGLADGYYCEAGAAGVDAK